MLKYKIVEIKNKNVSSLESLSREALSDGYGFVERTIKEWKSGENSFSKPGEKFWGLFVENKLIAIGGLNIDPYIENNNGKIGRVRHVYVAKKYRGKGLSKVIMGLILDKAKDNFDILRLSTKNPIAAHFYESLGFVKDQKESRKKSHQKVNSKFYILNISSNKIKKQTARLKVYPNSWRQAEDVLKNDGVVVLPTDTLYGVLGRAQSKKAVERIYEIKGRDENKPFIVLITSLKQIKDFGIKINTKQAKFLEKIWPGKVSVILPCPFKKWEYLHRGEKSIAFRMIGQKNKNLFNLINKTGALVAPTVNIQGGKPAENIREAKNYFKDNINLYINIGERKSQPSTLIKFKDDKIIILRQGSVIIKFP